MLRHDTVKRNVKSKQLQSFGFVECGYTSSRDDDLVSCFNDFYGGCCQSIPCKNKVLNQRWLIAGPPFSSMAQWLSNIG